MAAISVEVVGVLPVQPHLDKHEPNEVEPDAGLRQECLNVDGVLPPGVQTGLDQKNDNAYHVDDGDKK